MLSTLVASSGRPLCASSMACLTAATSSGEVLPLAAIASAGAERAGGGGGAAVDGRSGMVEGVNGGALRGTSAPPLPMTPDGGTDAVEVTGRAGTDSNIGPGAVFAVACAAGFAGLSDLCADSADFSDFGVGFADLSDLYAPRTCALRVWVVRICAFRASASALQSCRAFCRISCRACRAGWLAAPVAAHSHRKQAQRALRPSQGQWRQTRL